MVEVREGSAPKWLTSGLMAASSRMNLPLPQPMSRCIGSDGSRYASDQSGACVGT